MSYRIVTSETVFGEVDGEELDEDCSEEPYAKRELRSKKGKTNSSEQSKFSQFN